jgi:hypothetical protein
LADSYEFGNKHAGNFFDKLNTQKKQMWWSYVIKSKMPVFFLFVIFHSSRLMCIYCKYNKIPLIYHLKIWKCWYTSIWGEYYQKKSSLLKQVELWDMFTRPPGVPVNQPLWNHLTPCLLLYQILQLWRLHKKQKRTLMTVNQQQKEISSWNTLINCSAQV